LGIVSVNNGLQVLGGYGYTEDFILEQLARDVRIMSLYEGTTGIQAQTLLGREISKNDGRAFNYWKDEVLKDIDAAKNFDTLKKYGSQLLQELQELNTTTSHLLTISSKGDSEKFLSDATLYMELFGYINLAWQWLKLGVTAQRKLIEKDKSGEENFYRSKIETMQFFFHYELIKAKGLHVRLRDGKALTLWKEEEVLI
jgi:hypothetical protein